MVKSSRLPLYLEIELFPYGIQMTDCTFDLFRKKRLIASLYFLWIILAIYGNIVTNNTGITENCDINEFPSLLDIQKWKGSLKFFMLTA